MTLEELKRKFDSEVNTNDIEYDWDGGSCYSSINHPLLEEELKDAKEQDEWEDYCNEWLSEYEEERFDMCDVVEGGLANQYEVLVGEDAKEYAEGLIRLLKLTHGGKSQYLYTPYEQKVLELEKFVADMEFDKHVLHG
jgi:hypothetical protein